MYDAALKSFQSGRFDIAERRCRKALSADPAHADSLHLLGLVYGATNRLDLGIETIAQAIRSDSANPEYFSNLGKLLHRRGRFDEAFKSYDLALKLRPDFVGVWIQLGELLTRQNRLDEALLTYGHALSLDEGNAEAAERSADILKQLQRYEEAAARFDLLTRISPDNAGAFCKAGICLHELKRSDEAVPRLRRSIEIDRRNLDAHSYLGAALIRLGRSDEALAPLQRVLETSPDHAGVLNNLGLALNNLKRFDEALPMLDRAVAGVPDFAGAFNNKANALQGLGRDNEALAAYDRAIALKPDFAEAHYNRAICLNDMMRSEEAAAGYRDALIANPDYADAHFNLAINRLRAGDYRTGWAEAEWRWKCAGLQLEPRLFRQPLWRGCEPIEGKRLFVYNDEGLGDALQLCRYIPLAAARGAHVILEIDRPLRELLSRLEGVSEILAKGEAIPDFDYQSSLANLPLAFDTTLDTIPSKTPYLSAAGDARDWQAWLGERRGLRVGLVWSGNPKYRNDHNRSIPLGTLLPLLDVDAQFVSLQKDCRPGDAEILGARDRILNAGAELNNFADTAALLDHLDLVITVDTSVAHLAGALGRPAWVLLPRMPDWRWMLGRDDSLWYPSLRLFRQTETAKWPPVVQRVKQALQEMIGG